MTCPAALLLHPIPSWQGPVASRQVSGSAVTVCVLAVVLPFMHQVTDTTLLIAGPEPICGA
jgi:hypothetical protein